MSPRARPVIIGEVRELRREDLAALNENRSQIKTKTLRDTHHNLARMIAMGMRRSEVVEQSGYSSQRITQLMQDPAFNDLIASYRSVVTESFKDNLDIMHQQMVLARGKAARMLNDRLEDADESGELPPVRELLGILEITADRTGYGKRETKVNVNLDFASALEKARVRKERAMKEVSGTVDSAPPAPGPQQAEAHPAPAAAILPLKRRV